MKNRLQINYYMPSSWPYTRDAAVKFIETIFSKNVGATPSLPAEPIGVFYGADANTSNVILAIGRGGDGNDVLTNKPYFLIDTAKMDEHLKEIDGTIGNLDTILQTVKSDIVTLKEKDAAHDNSIQTLKREFQRLEKEMDAEDARISSTVDEVYSVLSKEIERSKGVDETNTTKIGQIDDSLIAEIKRSTEVDKSLRLAIDTEVSERKNAISDEIRNREYADNKLQSAIETEVNERKTACGDLSTRISAITETTIPNTENKILEALDKKIKEEKEDREKYDGENKDSIGKLNEKVDEEISRAKGVENTLNLAIESEIANRESGDTETLGKAESYCRGYAYKKGDVDNLKTQLEKSDSELQSQIKQNKVVSDDKTILLDRTGENTDIRVNIDNKTIKTNEGVLTVDSKALAQYVNGDSIRVVEVFDSNDKRIDLAINPDDKILVNTDTGLWADLKLVWGTEINENGEDIPLNEIRLVGKNGAIISTITVSEILKNGVVEGVEYDEVEKDLIFKFTNGTEIRVSINDLMNVYSAGDGLKLEGTKFAVKKHEESEDFLKVTENGIILSGVTNAITGSVNELKNKLNPRITGNTESIKQLQERDGELHNEIFSGLSEVRLYVDGEISESASAITSGYEQMGSKIREEFVKADGILSGRITSLETYTTKETERVDGEITNVKESMTTIKSDFSSIKNQIIAGDNKTLSEAKTYTDQLAEKVNTNTESLKTLNGSAGVDGSVNNKINQAILGLRVTDITPEHAADQSLLRVVEVGGVPYFYATNQASEIIYKTNEDGSKVSLVNAMNQVLDDNAKFREELDANKKLIDDMEDRINRLESQEYREEIINEVSKGIIDKILGSIRGTDEQIKVTTTTKTNEDGSETKELTIGFADGVIFQAGA